MTLQPFNLADYVTVTVTSLHAVTVVEVSGEIDMATRDAMADPLFAQLDNAPPGVVLDLTKIDFMGLAGLRVLVEAYQRAQQGDIGLGIVVPGGSLVRRVLEVSGLVQFLPVYRTIAEALHGVAVDLLAET
jgi:anti-sigma B factor antagonist